MKTVRDVIRARGGMTEIAESFKGQDHVKQIQAEAQEIGGRLV